MIKAVKCLCPFNDKDVARLLHNAYFCSVPCLIPAYTAHLGVCNVKTPDAEPCLLLNIINSFGYILCAFFRQRKYEKGKPLRGLSSYTREFCKFAYEVFYYSLRHNHQAYLEYRLQSFVVNRGRGYICSDCIT